MGDAMADTFDWFIKTGGGTSWIGDWSTCRGAAFDGRKASGWKCRLLACMRLKRASAISSDVGVVFVTGAAG